MRPTRRRVLAGIGGLGGLGGLAGLPRLARAASGTPGRRFVFVLAPGGWDVTRVFVPAFDNAAVAMESVAEPWTIGGLSLVDHPARPSVRSFFEQWHERSVVLNGLLVRSIAHEICMMISLTGDTSGARPDWATLLGAADADRFVIPHLVLAGPAFPGDQGVVVGRAGEDGQLDRLVDGSAVTLADGAAGGPSVAAEGVLDRFVAARAQARADAARSTGARTLLGQVAAAGQYAGRVKVTGADVRFSGGSRLAERAQVAVDVLAAGVARCVTVAADPGELGWDSHTDNDQNQSPLWEDLFDGLGALVAALEDAPSPDGGTLADDTVVVVLSELGRAPGINSFNGKDHWPYTSAMLVGRGLVGSRVVGAFDERYYGVPVDPGSGEVAADGPLLTAEALGATLLALGGVDPGPLVPGFDPITGLFG